MRTGLLLINLGTPESPRTADVRAYLREFLLDPRVIDIPAWRRWMLVNLLILPFRPRESGAAYRKIWSDAGSPLLVHGHALKKKVQNRVGDNVVVELAMRYGRPSIAEALARYRQSGIDQIVVFPLYPQYSSAANGSSMECVMTVAAGLWNVPQLQFVPPFYDHPAFLDACARVSRPVLEAADAEKVFFSFHGLPERQVRKSDDTGRHCLPDGDPAGYGACCEQIGTANRNCYRAQCIATARGLASRLGVTAEQSVVCFQSRLGRTPWIRPYTDILLAETARAGVRRAAILSPAFVADCLETTEELGMRGVDTWKANGGESLAVAPCVNADDQWADAVVTIAREHSAWLARENAGAAAEAVVPMRDRS